MYHLKFMYKMKKILALSIATIGMIACGNDDSTTMEEQTVAFETLAKGNDLDLYDNLNQNLNLIISNDNEFENFVTTTSFNTSNFPTVNYYSSKVIVLLGKLSQTGSNYEISNITETSEHIMINLTETYNDATVMSKPYHIVKINQTSKPILFN
ncbi:hypothetical protein AB4865_04915 [Capnocytophaga sp. ARDL2]|uniref:hypothetical protein n=1 Tax=Capnocytophaga sp. ARDL2 TaxID=3238809 RepID=UPI003557B2BE